MKKILLALLVATLAIGSAQAAPDTSKGAKGPAWWWCYFNLNVEKNCKGNAPWKDWF